MGSKPKILIVEDEEAILRGLVDLFTYHGFEVDAVSDGESALISFAAQSYSIVILDVMLPRMDGFSVCSEIRKKDRDLPIIMLTAKAAEENIITGFSLGADDYVTKPFSVSELVFRVKAVLRRSKRDNLQAEKIVIGQDLSIDIATLNGTRSTNGEQIEFTRREVDILLYLHRHSQDSVSRADLLTDVWGYERASQIETRTVDIHIAKLRRKIEQDAKNPKFLITVRGEGYSLKLSEIVDA